MSDRLEDSKKRHVERGENPPPEHFFYGLALRNHIKKHTNIKLKVFTMVRDPVALLVSGIWQNKKAYDFFLDEKYNKNQDFLIEEINKHINSPTSYDYIFNWFDFELKAVMGVDVFAYPFSENDGWTIINCDRAEVMVITLEALSGMFSKAIPEFLNINKIELINANVRSHSDDSSLYHRIVNSVMLTPEMIDFVYSSKFVQHFYPKNDINRFMHKWS